jgi:hypothetical protein
MSGYAFAVAVCVALVGLLVVLLRTRRLREKYAIIWIVVGLAVAVFAEFPRAVEKVARAVGVQTPSNLVFALALVALLLVCVQLSMEITRLEEETRTLAEAVALLRLDVERATGVQGGAAEPPSDEVETPPVDASSSVEQTT